jgi:hypothetical protein
LNLFDLLPTASWDFLSRQPYLLMIPISQPTSRETINQRWYDCLSCQVIVGWYIPISSISPLHPQYISLYPLHF